MGISVSREIRYGIISCLLGTVAMDLVALVEYQLTGQPLDTSFVLYGALIGGGVTVGLVLHVLFGAMLGILFGVTVSRFDAFRIDSVRKALWDGVLAGLITIPLGCVPFAVLVGVPLTTMIPFVTAPHLVWGLVMGRLMGYFLIDLNAS